MLLLLIILQFFAPIFGKPLIPSNYAKLQLYQSPDLMYYIQNLELGSPPQSISNIILDTGSSDLVVTNETYNLLKSHAYSNTLESYPEKFGSTDLFYVNKVEDTFGGSLWKIKEFTFALANRTDLDSFSGILGVGYMANEAMKANQYENLPVKLKSSKITKRAMFSINGQSSNPSIVFGGVYSRIFKSPLTKMPFTRQVGNFSTLAYNNLLSLTVNSIEVGGTVVSNQKLMYEIDSGANGFATTIPVLNNILVALGNDFQVIQDNVYYPIEKLKEVYITVDVQGFVIKFPIMDIVGDRQVVQGIEYGGLNLAPVMIGTNSYHGTLPNCILQYYYTVYDLEENFFLIGEYAGKDDSHVGIVSNNYDVATVSAPKAAETYSVLYQDYLETTLTPSTESAENSQTPSEIATDTSSSIYISGSSSTAISTVLPSTILANPSSTSSPCRRKIRSHP